MENISLISDNCWAYFIYTKVLKINYTSPLIGGLMHTPDYIKFLEHFWDYLKIDIKIVRAKESKWYEKMKEFYYPNGCHSKEHRVGILEDIEFIFLNYPFNMPDSEIKQKWDERKQRIPINEKNIIFKLGVPYMDRHFEYEDIDSLVERFYNLPYSNKISFTSRKYDFPNNFLIDPEKVRNYDHAMNINDLINLDEWPSITICERKLIENTSIGETGACNNIATGENNG